jgi:type VI protein secretion system component VasK
VDEESSAPRRKVKLDSVEEIEARAAKGSQARKEQRRRKRLAIGVVVSVAVAGSVGVWLGFQSHRTDEEIAQEMRGQARGQEFDLNKQADRLISEMWKTEALEKIPGR